jgi:hypothetical protein
MVLVLKSQRNGVKHRKEHVPSIGSVEKVERGLELSDFCAFVFFFVL